MKNSHQIGFGDWLMRRYLNWQVNVSTGRKTQAAFAEYLGVTKQELLSWFNYVEEPTNGELLMKLAARLGEDLYDHLSVRPPNIESNPDPKKQ